MTPERYNQLMDDLMTQLTEEEWKAGWHFCFDWDGLLIGPGMKECEVCLCDVPKPAPMMGICAFSFGYLPKPK